MLFRSAHPPCSILLAQRRTGKARWTSRTSCLRPRTRSPSHRGSRPRPTRGSTSPLRSGRRRERVERRECRRGTMRVAEPGSAADSRAVGCRPRATSRPTTARRRLPARARDSTRRGLRRCGTCVTGRAKSRLRTRRTRSSVRTRRPRLQCKRARVSFVLCSLTGQSYLVLQI